MKRFLIFAAIVALFSSVMLCSTPKDLKNILSGLTHRDSTEKVTERGRNILSDIVSGYTSKKDLTVADLAGKWKYEAPAVDLQSDDALKGFAGKGASAMAKEKLAPYYAQAGLTDMTMDVDKDGNFTISLKRGSLKGQFSKDENGQMWAEFKALGKISIGKYETWATLSADGKELTLTFDMSRLIQIVRGLSTITKNQTAQTAVKLLENFDGINAGFTLRRV